MATRDKFFAELDDLRWDFAAILRRLREERFKTQAAFAKHAKVSPKTVSKLECGGSDPALSMLLILTEALNSAPDDGQEWGAEAAAEVTTTTLTAGLDAPKRRKPPPHHK